MEERRGSTGCVGLERIDRVGIAEVPILTQRLLERGLAEDEVVGVLGENALAFLGRVWGD